MRHPQGPCTGLLTLILWELGTHEDGVLQPPRCACRYGGVAVENVVVALHLPWWVSVAAMQTEGQTCSLLM